MGKKHQKACKLFLSDKCCHHGKKWNFKRNSEFKNDDDKEKNYLNVEIKALKAAVEKKEQLIQSLTKSIANLDERYAEMENILKQEKNENKKNAAIVKCKN